MIIAALIDVAGNVGYPLVFVLVGVESMGIPVPGETALITAALTASSGRLEIEWVSVGLLRNRMRFSQTTGQRIGQ